MLERAARVLVLMALPAAAAACKHSSDTLHVFFRDELVEAPARTVDLVAYLGLDCDAILSKRHDEQMPMGMVLARRSTKYPVNPGSNLLDNLPRGMPIALDVATYDRDQILIGRGCDVVTLESGGASTVEMEMHALPVCKMGPTTIDFGVVLDVSMDIGAADPSNVHLSEFDRTIMAAASRFSPPATWTLVTDNDQEGPKELVAQTADTAMIQNALNALITIHTGGPRAYDGVVLAAKKLRARAVCGVKPMLIVMLGDAEQNPPLGARDEAVVEIVATRGDPTDDLYTYGLAFSDAAYDELNQMIPVEVGVATGAQGETQIRAKMGEIAMAIRGLIH